jgi:hypothetical protein
MRSWSSDRAEVVIALSKRTGTAWSLEQDIRSLAGIPAGRLVGSLPVFRCAEEQSMVTKHRDETRRSSPPVAAVSFVSYSSRGLRMNRT